MYLSRVIENPAQIRYEKIRISVLLTYKSIREFIRVFAVYTIALLNYRQPNPSEKRLFQRTNDRQYDSLYECYFLIRK